MREELLKIWDPEVRTLLDLGCRDCWHTKSLPGVVRHVGVEVWEAALLRGTLANIPFFEPVLSEALKFMYDLKPGSFDAVLAIDLLEHLKKDRGIELLGQMIRVASKMVVVWTTLGFVHQGPFDVDGQPNPYEEHLWGPVQRMFVEMDWQSLAFPWWHEGRGGALLAWQLLS